ncbi:creatinine amidohydrolase [Faunimonas pinastri]|uniref:Creatinine amidohydrolase n=1 Tax=Faunimonas pinastri TaxID=1855383 RepID=A0A1H9Q016_9HYPH|nr:creatininase family protein [Faunimonas pinastri]SER53740.1 creatinine amidohydrolase [Faunimonas pinastri]
MTVQETDAELLNDREMRTLLARRPVVLLPMGAVESHGDHLPAGTDNILARRLAERLVERVAGRTPLLLLPLLPFGQVWSLADAPGSFTLSNETVSRTLVEIGRAARTKGLSTIVAINAHYGNAVAIRDAQRVLKEEGVTLAAFNYPGAGTPTEAVRERPAAHPAFMHACEIETSYMLHLAPEHVRMDEAIENYPAFPDDFGEVPYRWSEFSDSPVLGDARAATAEKGRTILDAVLDRMAELVARLHERQPQA